MISETVQKAAERYLIIVPTASLYRKAVKTAVHCPYITEGKMRALNRHMSHSDATSSKFYQLPAVKKAVDVYNTIKALSKKDFFHNWNTGCLLRSSLSVRLLHQAWNCAAKLLKGIRCKELRNSSKIVGSHYQKVLFNINI